eukprot:m.52 g.52  ORF g.52 m.52 type:complete len:74 (-) comp83_c0_seq1:78-299(-)
MIEDEMEVISVDMRGRGARGYFSPRMAGSSESLWLLAAAATVTLDGKRDESSGSIILAPSTQRFTKQPMTISC